MKLFEINIEAGRKSLHITLLLFPICVFSICSFHTPSSLNSSDQLGVASSNVITLDASGSMYGSDIQDINGNPYTMHRLTALAAHQFVSEKSEADEIGVVVFDHFVNLINKDFLNLYSFVDANEDIVQLDYSVSGFTNNKAKLHFAVDLYNPNAGLWNESYYTGVYDEKHSDRVDSIVSTRSDYQWGQTLTLKLNFKNDSPQ